MKTFTETNFNWYFTAPDGKKIASAEGAYIITSDSLFVETVTDAQPQTELINNKSEMDFKIKGDTLITKFTLMRHNYSEK